MEGGFLHIGQCQHTRNETNLASGVGRLLHSAHCSPSTSSLAAAQVSKFLHQLITRVATLTTTAPHILELLSGVDQPTSIWILSLSARVLSPELLDRGEESDLVHRDAIPVDRPHEDGL